MDGLNLEYIKNAFESTIFLKRRPQYESEQMLEWTLYKRTYPKRNEPYEKMSDFLSLWGNIG